MVIFAQFFWLNPVPYQSGVYLDLTFISLIVSANWCKDLEMFDSLTLFLLFLSVGQSLDPIRYRKRRNDYRSSIYNLSNYGDFEKDKCFRD